MGDCKKDCEPYRIVDGRQRDYEIKGNGFHHDSTRKVRCIKGYGAVAGSPDAMRFYKETVTCVNGAWTERSLVLVVLRRPQRGPERLVDRHRGGLPQRRVLRLPLLFVAPARMRRLPGREGELPRVLPHLRGGPHEVQGEGRHRRQVGREAPGEVAQEEAAPPGWLPEPRHRPPTGEGRPPRQEGVD